MPATDYVNSIYAAVKALLLANGSPFLAAVKPNNRGWMDAGGNPAPSIKPAILPADAVEMESFDYDGGDYSASTFDEHYTSGQDVSEQAWTESDTHRFTFTLYGMDLRLTPLNAAIQSIRECLRAAGDDLGLPYVQRWSLARRDTRETIKNGFRRKVVVTLTVTIAVDGAGELE